MKTVDNKISEGGDFPELSTFFNIDKVHIKDVDLLVQIFDNYRQSEGERTDREGAKSFLLERLSGEELTAFIATCENKCAVGFVNLYKSFSSVKMQQILILNDLFVIPEFRNRGVGRALMQASYDLAKTSTVQRLELKVLRDNLSARRLYEKADFAANFEDVYYTRTIQAPVN